MGGFQVKKKLVVHLFSDSVVSAAAELSSMVMNQYPRIEATFHYDSFVQTITQCEEKLKDIDAEFSFILFSFLNKDLTIFLRNYCRHNQITYLDLVTPIEQKINLQTGETPIQNEEAPKKLSENYFNRIDAIEFAVQFDDGQNPKGFLQADIVLLGVSRTSKTPLSMYLANHNYKVANLPLLPSLKIPSELWEVPTDRIVGLTTDADVLSAIQKERMRSYGVETKNLYSDLEQIKVEIQNAEKLYEKLGCLVINVSSKSIEETASIIFKKLNS